MTKDKIESGSTLGHVLINLVDGRKISVNMVARSALFQTNISKCKPHSVANAMMSTSRKLSSQLPIEKVW